MKAKNTCNKKRVKEIRFPLHVHVDMFILDIFGYIYYPNTYLKINNSFMS